MTHSKENPRPSSYPQAKANNKTIALPMIACRETIAGNWRKVTEILVGIRHQTHVTLLAKILECKAYSPHIQQGIATIRLQFQSPAAIPAELDKLFEAIEYQVAIIQDIRAKLMEANPGMIGGFLAHRYYSTYYESVLSLPERSSLASEGFLRASDTFCPVLPDGTDRSLTTYAYTWMKSLISKEGEKKKKERDCVSLDATTSGEEDGLSILSRTPSSAQTPLAQFAEADVCRSVQDFLTTLPRWEERVIRLKFGIGVEAVHSNDEIAGILRGEKYVGERGALATSDRVQGLLRSGMNRMKSSFSFSFEDLRLFTRSD